MPEIEYRIESADTDRREFHIAIHFTPRKENYPITLRMPAWTPGSYLLREYAGSISDIEAYQGETPLNVIKSDKATFVLANTSGDRTPVTIRYEGEENFVGDSEIIALGGASNETKDRPLG